MDVAADYREKLGANMNIRFITTVFGDWFMTVHNL